MWMYNLIGYGENYSKGSGIFWQYYSDEPAINDADGNLAEFPGNSATFKFKQKLTGKTENNGTKKPK